MGNKMAGEVHKQRIVPSSTKISPAGRDDSLIKFSEYAMTSKNIIQVNYLLYLFFY